MIVQSRRVGKTGRETAVSVGWGLVVPPEGPIRVEPIEADVVAWVRRWTGARTVERLRLGASVIEADSFVWMDEDGRARNLEPNRRAGELVCICSGRRLWSDQPLVGAVCVTGGDTEDGETRGLEQEDLLALRQVMGDPGPTG
jgi:hypothetical protein